MSDDDLRKIRYSREVEENLRQFLKLESGLGNSSKFQRGWVYNFEFTQEQRDSVNALMAAGRTFDDAFDEVKRGTPEK
jgi:hypothetical protein